MQKISKNSSAKYYKKKQGNASNNMYQDLTEDLSCDMCQDRSEEDENKK